MAKKLCRSDYGLIINLLQDLKKNYPTYTIGQHISTALFEYGNIWGLTDKEFLFAMDKYKVELESNTVSDIEVDEIVKDAQDLDKILGDNYGDEED